MINVIWHEFLKIVSEEVGSRIVETWFKAVLLSNWDASSRTVYLKAPNAFVKDWITANYINLVRVHLCRLLNESDIKIIFIDNSSNAILKQDVVANQAKALSQIPNIQDKNLPAAQKKPIQKIGGLNAAFSFDTFVVGPTNSLAYAAAKAVAERPGYLYNPLFIYGDSGLGKTHLLHAIGNGIKLAHPDLRVLYQTADRFVSEFINAIRFDKINIFENKYKNIDALLIDDIQFISNKEQTQEIFFHIFNTLYESKKQIVFSSDALPRDIEGLATRLRSRLDGGLVADIQKPTLETKIAIIKRKADLHQQVITDDVAHYIASQVLSNIRELEGLLVRVIAFASLTYQSINLELTQKVLSKIVRNEDKSKKISVDLPEIANKVAQHFDYSLSELRSNKRHKNLVQARHIAIYLMKKHTGNSLTDIGTYLRRKDHSTVIHAIEKIESSKKNDQIFYKRLTELEEKILNK